MKKHLKYFFSALLLISMSQITKAQNVNIILDFTNRKVSADGLSWTFDLEAKGDVGYAGPNNNNWKAYNIRLDLDLPDGVEILGGTGVADPNFTTGSLGVQNVVLGSPPMGQKAMGLTLSRGNQTDLNTSTFVKLATYTINFSGPVNQGDPATPRPNAIASGSSWTNGANDPASGNPLGLRRPFLMAQSFALPITLLSFDAAKEGNAINLAWSTTEEINSDRFDVQRSGNGKEWNTIETVAAKGESKQQVEYSAVDSDPLEGNNLYRLHMIDKDGTSAYSRIRTVKFEGVATYMYPNPVSDELTIKAVDWSKVMKVEIVSSNGKKVYSSEKPSPNVNVKNLRNGVYLVRLTNSNGSETTHKIVVNN
ncbi:T9SS type A sorting domain-containing protein [Dyadobacter fanqingshengii]|uniref:T9SS type A sorting domain-containing protein n=1 Tax=Dyadobacter fanqingshengii TaxID=2906443 RepID=A0A9X1PFA9_9BACT|nr:T9SS type A sorting domain-containing protein [Dyadobacter fanqingshengii]MCF0042192.1 T9SS type A sorting domain-containing protein [Dyadobacter fanqingshengii]USJ35276.1 T9SS type A sorting domain-containing protein [Dyadobacter fanqingshengii]